MHVASAEIDEDKQRFLVDTSLEPGGITQLFANIHDLAKDEAPNLASTGWALGGDEEPARPHACEHAGYIIFHSGFFVHQRIAVKR